MKKINTRLPFNEYLFRMLLEYKRLDTHNEFCNYTKIINEILQEYANGSNYKSITIHPTKWKKDNGKVYLRFKFEVDYKCGKTAFLNFSQLDNEMKRWYNRYV